jgi:hypothetical protein
MLTPGMFAVVSAEYIKRSAGLVLPAESDAMKKQETPVEKPRSVIVCPFCDKHTYTDTGFCYRCKKALIFCPCTVSNIIRVGEAHRREVAGI